MKLLPVNAKHPAFLVLVACAVATLFSYLGRVHWFLDLFSHFPLQYAVVLVVLAICGAVMRQRLLIGGSLLLLLPHLASLSYYFPGPGPAPASASRPLKVTAFNVLTTNPRHEEVLRHLQETDSDVILLLEVSAGWVEALRPLEKSHPHFRQIPRSDNFGIALYSRLPIRNHRVVTLPPGLPCMVTQVDWHGTPLTIVGGHPPPPVGGGATRFRDHYLAELGTLAGNLSATAPVLLLGDLNTTPWSHCFRELVKTSGLEDSGRHRGFLSSWKRLNPLFTLPLDHMLHSSGLQAVDRWVGPALGSDHRPVGGTFQRSAIR